MKAPDHASTSPRRIPLPTLGTEFRVVRLTSGLLIGLLIGALAVCVHLALLWTWNTYIDPFVAWNERGFNAMHFIPLLMGGFVYHYAFGVACEQIRYKFESWINPKVAAWSAFSVAMVSALLFFAFILLAGYSVGGFGGFQMGAYGVIMLCASGWGALNGVQVVTPRRYY